MVWLWMVCWLWQRVMGLMRVARHMPRGHRHGSNADNIAPARHARNRPKPPWVRHEVIRLRAWSPELSSRNLVEVFNRQFAERGVSVGRTHVATTLRGATADIVHLRRTHKNRVPKAMPRNRVWALDLTGKADLSGRQRMVLGLFDHGTRACLRLSVLTDKRSITVIAELLIAFRRFGLPKRLRVDNEACFNSHLMRSALALLGVRLQTTELHCPWQNGRIERFFGTFKQPLDRITIADADDLRCKLIEFRAWYNHVRTHQHLHLHGHTPTEAWDGRANSIRRPQWFEVWEGRITGWFFPP
jgi:transposase InsO family protein